MNKLEEHANSHRLSSSLSHQPCHTSSHAHGCKGARAGTFYVNNALDIVDALRPARGGLLSSRWGSRAVSCAEDISGTHNRSELSTPAQSYSP